MVVGRLLSYWEGNFSGAVLNFGGVTPVLFSPPFFPLKTSFSDTKALRQNVSMPPWSDDSDRSHGIRTCRNKPMVSFIWGPLGKGEMFTFFVRGLRSRPNIYGKIGKKVTQVQHFLGFCGPLMLRHFTNHSPVHRGIPLANVWTPHLPPPRINRAFRLKTLVENSKPYTGS